MTLAPRAVLTLLLVSTLLGVLLIQPAQAAPGRTADRHWSGHPGRTLVDYRVRPGDTASVIARRFHAWTAELQRINHRTAGSLWRVGEKVVVPVVTARAQRSTPRTTPGHPSKARVRAEVVRAARAHDMRPKLALALAWQESGWQQHVRSSVGAIGTMQVMPANKSWLSQLFGRELRLKKLHDNVNAGVVLFRNLRAHHTVRTSIAAYYQGIGSIRSHGRYRSTKAYVRNVLHHWKRLRHGWDPLTQV